MSLGEKLKRLRESKDFTMEEMCNAFNETFDVTINKSMISRWESNKATPLNTYLTYYAKYFNVTLDYLLDIDIENPDNPKFYLSPKERVIRLLGEEVVSANTGININDFNDEELNQIADRLLEYARFLGHEKRMDK